MRRRNHFGRLLLAVILFSACLIALVFPLMLVSLPERAAQLYGPPDPSLGARQRLGYSLALILQEQDLTSPLDPNGSPITFDVQMGESAGSVVARLAAQDLIANPEAFRTYLLYTGLDKRLQAGKYELSPAMSAVQLARAMLDPTPKLVDFHILPGWRLEEIAAALPTSGLSITPELFLSAVRTPPADFPFRTGFPAGAGLEGFLYPEMYTLSRSLSTQELLEVLLARFQEQMTPEIQQGFNRQGLTVYQGIVLASIIEREAVDEGEMPLIASVFYNRLAQGMKLDSDPTVQYARGYNNEQKTWWTNPLSLADLELDSPYNTYRYPGLPPGPIANPGLPAWRAAAFPGESPYLYFRAACDGSGRHNFARTFQEHLDNGCP